MEVNHKQAWINGANFIGDINDNMFDLITAICFMNCYFQGKRKEKTVKFIHEKNLNYLLVIH